MEMQCKERGGVNQRSAAAWVRSCVRASRTRVRGKTRSFSTKDAQAHGQRYASASNGRLCLFLSGGSSSVKRPSLAEEHASQRQPAPASTTVSYARLNAHAARPQCKATSLFWT